MPAPSAADWTIFYLHSSIFLSNCRVTCHSSRVSHTSGPNTTVAGPLCVKLSPTPVLLGRAYSRAGTREPVVRFVSKFSPPESQYRKPLALNSRSELHLNPQPSTLNHSCPVSGHPAASFCSRCRCPNRLKTNDFRPFSTCFIRAARTVLRTLENCSKIF